MLAIGYVLLGCAALVLFAAPLRYAWEGTVRDFRVELLQEDTERFSAVFRERGPAALAAFIKERVAMKIAGERILLFTDSALHPLAGNLPTWPRGIPSRPGSYTLPVDLGGREQRVSIVRTALPGGYNLLVGRDVQRLAPLERRFWSGLAAAVAVLTAAGIMGGILIRRALLSRIHSIQQTVAAIMRGDLSHRLPVRSSGDELDTLAQTINRMLEQIEQLVHGVANVSNSIAHDLRTPLTELRARLEELSVTRPAPAETFQEIEVAVSDVDAVIRIFNALLRLAEIDAGMRRSAFVDIDIAKVAAQAVEFYLPAGELENLSFVFRDPGPVWVRGDSVLLAQAVNNLVDNALKYVGRGGRIVVEIVSRSDAAVSVVVADNGPGIADADKPKAAQRFFRGDASRGTPGVGLGLSLVEAVARLHGGSLALADNHPGLRAQLTIAREPVRQTAEVAAPQASPAHARAHSTAEQAAQHAAGLVP